MSINSPSNIWSQNLITTNETVKNNLIVSSMTNGRYLKSSSNGLIVESTSCNTSSSIADITNINNGYIVIGNASSQGTTSDTITISATGSTFKNNVSMTGNLITDGHTIQSTGVSGESSLNIKSSNTTNIASIYLNNGYLYPNYSNTGSILCNTSGNLVITSNNSLVLGNTTNATSTSSAAVLLNGGLGVAKTIYSSSANIVNSLSIGNEIITSTQSGAYSYRFNQFFSGLSSSTLVLSISSTATTSQECNGVISIKISTYSSHDLTNGYNISNISFENKAGVMTYSSFGSLSGGENMILTPSTASSTIKLSIAPHETSTCSGLISYDIVLSAGTNTSNNVIYNPAWVITPSF